MSGTLPECDTIKIEYVAHKVKQGTIVVLNTIKALSRAHRIISRAIGLY